MRVLSRYFEPPRICEALALRDAIQFAVQLGVERVVFVTDSSQLIQFCKDIVNNRSVVCPILDEIYE